MIGATLGPYRVLDKLGEGGMGEVYKATDTRLGRIVAIKVLPQAHTDDPERQQRFDREARAIAALSHPNICALFDIGRLRVSDASADQGRGGVSDASADQGRGDLSDASADQGRGDLSDASADQGRGDLTDVSADQGRRDLTDASADQGRGDLTDASADQGHGDEVSFLVMEYLEGETLAERIARGGRRSGSGSRSVAAPVTPHDRSASAEKAASTRGGRPLPVAETIRIATALAEALAAAHKAGIVHRDLKPGNIMLTKSGVKVLDFGLAKALGRNSEADIGGDATMTATTPLTGVGSLLGTMPYMAPEQVEGREADARSDIFALGSVIYEMATGQRAFDSPSQAGLIAAILERQPEPISAVEPVTPPALERVVTTCLAKDPDERWQHASDIARQLKWMASDSGTGSAATPGAAASAWESGTPPASGANRGASWPAAAIAITAIAFGAFVVWSGLQSRGASSRSAGDSIEFAVGIPGVVLTESSISPDGRTLALIGVRDNGEAGLWLRRLESATATEIESVEGVSTGLAPVWSPDGDELSVLTDRGRLIVRMDGGPARLLATQDNQVWQIRTWAPGGVMIGGWADGLWTYDLATDKRVDLEDGISMHPRALADGRRILYSATAEAGESANPDGVYVRSIEPSGERRLVVQGASTVAVDAGHLLFVRDGTLFAQPFDADSAEVSGTPQAVLDGVDFFKPHGAADFDAAGGNIVYSTRNPDETPAWYGRDGGELGGLATAPGLYYEVAISPGGRRLVVARSDRRTGTGDLWLFDVAGGAPRRLTNDAGAEYSLRWAPDNRRLLYGSDVTGPPDVFLLDVDSGEPTTKIFATPGVDSPAGWLSTETLLAQTSDPSAGRFRAVAVSGEVLDDDYSTLAQGARLSPDSRWAVYESRGTSQTEIYVRPVGRPGPAVAVSRGTGRSAVWGSDSTTLYFARGSAVFQVDLRPGQVITAAPPRQLFTIAREIDRFDVTPDGERFLILNDVPSDFQPIRVLVNWPARLRR